MEWWNSLVGKHAGFLGAGRAVSCEMLHRKRRDITWGGFVFCASCFRIFFVNVTWDKSNLVQFAVTEPCSGCSSRADMQRCSKLLSASVQMSQSVSVTARRGMLVGTGAVVLHTTLYSLAEGPEAQQVFGGSARALSLVTPGGCCHVFWPLYPTVLHLFGAACFTSPSQTAAVVIAGGQSGKSARKP